MNKLNKIIMLSMLILGVTKGTSDGSRSSEYQIYRKVGPVEEILNSPKPEIEELRENLSLLSDAEFKTFLRNYEIEKNGTRISIEMKYNDKDDYYDDDYYDDDHPKVFDREIYVKIEKKDQKYPKYLLRFIHMINRNEWLAQVSGAEYRKEWPDMEKILTELRNYKNFSISNTTEDVKNLLIARKE